MEDQREVELGCIAAIFPELVLGPQDSFSASLELPVHPGNPVKVVFPASAQGFVPDTPTPPQSDNSSSDGQTTPNPANNVESHDLSYLPSLQLHIVLPEGYPATSPPRFELSTEPEWLSRAYLDELQAKGEQMWEEVGHTEVVYEYIDSLQQAAENAFGYAEGKVLEIPQEFKIALLDYDIKATQAAFDKETFDCGVCLDPKKGSVCHRMIDCGHVFCVQCLQDFYNNAITEGDLVSVRCLAPDCAKKRAEAQPSKKSRKPKTLSPSELLQIPLEHEMVTRYVKLKHKADLESDKNTVYCPRKWCQGAARSKKHRKPDGFEVIESDDESDAEEDNKKFRAGRDLLSVCEDCSFAFCSRCYQGWHGEFTLCAPRANNGELTEEDKASLEYLKLHTTPCPTCAAPAQKTHGCNHMICFKCNTHFCYLCSAWLEPSNPYKHYNEVNTGCYMRLWELEAGDGDDVGIGYAGGAQAPEPEDIIEIVSDDELDDLEGGLADVGPRGPELPNGAGDVRDGRAPPAEALHNEGVERVVGDNNQPAPGPEPPAQQLQREGPLVLRINAVPQPAPTVAAVPDPPQPAQPAQPAQRHRQQRRGNPNRRIDHRPADVRQAGPPGGRGRGLRPQQPAGRGQARDVAAAQAQEAAHQQWLQRFVQMALVDEEDQVEWDSDDEDAAAWEIPVR